MASTNPFDLLVDDDNDDPIQLLAKLPAAAPTTKKIPVGGAAAKPAAKLPSKPLPPAQAVREAKTDGQRGGGRFGGRGGGRGGGFNREFVGDESSFGNNNGFSGGYRASENGDVERRGGPRIGNRGGRRGGYTNGDATEGGERPRRVFERRSGTGRGNEFKREGAGRGNWGTAVDEVAPETEEPVTETEKVVDSDEQENGTEVNKENTTVDVVAENEPEEKEMTLEEYEKVLEEKRKALDSLKSEERKVEVDKELATMQLLSNKKNEEDIFVKLGSEKDKRKESADKEEKAKKSVSIDEFLKPAEGKRVNGRGRGRGRGFSGGYGGGNRMTNNVVAPSIADATQFPSLSVK